MASSEMALVRSSMLLLRRSITSRALAAAERRVFPRVIVAAPTIRHLRTRGDRQPEQRKPDEAKDGQPQEPPALNSQLAQTLAESDQSDLVSEVRIQDDPDGVLHLEHPAMSILNNSALVIQRQMEMMNVLIGFEQANRYIIMNGEGETVGYIAEQDHGIGRSIARQMARTHRSFTTFIFDKDQREVLRIHRPFAFINTKIRIYDAIGDRGSADSTEVTTGHENFVQNASISPLKLEEMKIIGECQSQWTALRRKYNLFSMRSGGQDVSLDKADENAIEQRMEQFSLIDEPMLSWDFTVREDDGKVIGSVNRNFGGFAREIFTDTGVYALRMDAAAQTSALETADGKEIARYEVPGLTLDQRAVLIATAVSIDFDYFSRHSRGGGFMPMYIPMGGTAAEGAAAAGGVEAAGGAIAGTAARGAAGAGMGAVETGAVGAGTMAGYEAMQRGYGGGDDASPQAAQPETPSSFEQTENQPGNDNVWGTEQDPWSESTPDVGDVGESGGGWLSTLMDLFKDS